MPKDKDSSTEREQEIAKSLNPSSYDATTPRAQFVDIKYVNPSDELNGVYAGQEVCLTAVLTGGKKDDYDFIWRIDRGGFKNAKAQLVVINQAKFLETEDSSDNVCISTNGAAGQSIKVTVLAK